jgi:lipoprotein-anchoring transpeptidase ErfK/SrfK
MAPRGWKKQEIKYVCQTKSITQPSSDISFKLFKKNKTKIKTKTKTKKVFVCKKVIQPVTSSYKTFRSKTNLRKSFKVYKNNKLLKKASYKNTKLTVDISEQRVKLYVNNMVALDTPCTTGAKRKFEPNTKIYRDKRTPKGTFRISEKLRDKRSTIFGDYYRGKKRVYHGDKRKFKGSKKGLRYKGASLKNWMRLTSSGIGLHASKYVKRNPGTNGCIRLPYNVSKTIFKHVRKGTKVSIVN